MRSVLPSGAARAAASAAVLAPAPGRVSPTPRRPRARPGSLAGEGAMVSVVPPGGAPTRIRTGTDEPWAKEPPAAASARAATSARRVRGERDGFILSNTQVSLPQPVGREQFGAAAGELDGAVLQHI